MLRLFLTVSVLFWNQLAAQDEAEEVNQFCKHLHCLEPLTIIKGEKYDIMEFADLQWVETVVDGMNNDAFQVGLEKLFNYSHFGNDAGTAVPASAPWGVIGTLKNGEIQSRCIVFLMFVPELEIIPEPLDETVGIGGVPSNWFYVRTFEQKVEIEQYPELVTEFMKDLEQDNKKFDDNLFVVATYSTKGLMEIGFKVLK
ncbi:heme-binding protein 2-like [Mustelus asterias]